MTEEHKKVKIIKVKDNAGRQAEYALQQELGKGCSGRVYKAINIREQEKVYAVKVIKLESEKAKEACLRQLEVVQRLPNSPNIVKFLPQHLESENNFYIFQEYCNGGTLCDYKIRRRKFGVMPEKEVYNLFFQLASGFLELCRHGVYHEDIKSQNILLHNNLFKFVDFGVSQLQAKLEDKIIRKGTMIYMAPEKLRELTFKPTHKTEIFSLGITLFQVIFGRYPHVERKPIDYKQYLHVIDKIKYPSVEELKQEFPYRSLQFERLLRVILKMIAVKESQRLSLQQLVEYIQNTEPFKSMKIEEKILNVKEEKKQTKYECIQRSTIHVAIYSNQLTDLLGEAPPSAQGQIEGQLKLYNSYLQFFRDVTGFLQQGLIYIRKSNLIPKFVASSFGPRISKLDEISFISYKLMELMYKKLEFLVEKLVYEHEVSQQQMSEAIEADKQFIENEFINFVTTVQIEDKDQIMKQFKEKVNELPTIVAKEFRSLLGERKSNSFGLISDVRVNFKVDLLGFLFIKVVSEIAGFVEQIIPKLQEHDILSKKPSNQALLQLLQSLDYKNARAILVDFSQAETLDIEEVRKKFHAEAKNFFILEDDTPNEEFQQLDIKDFK